MPRKNFENIGVLQGYEYIRGVITDDPDYTRDTCTVRVKDAEGNDVDYADTPIFYHCTEDAEEREDNGAIEGGSAGFVKDDEVIVLKQRKGAPGHDGEPASEPKIFVIGHAEGIKACGLAIKITSVNGFTPEEPPFWNKFQVILSQPIETEYAVQYKGTYTEDFRFLTAPLRPDDAGVVVLDVASFLYPIDPAQPLHVWIRHTDLTSMYYTTDIKGDFADRAFFLTESGYWVYDSLYNQYYGINTAASLGLEYSYFLDKVWGARHPDNLLTMSKSSFLDENSVSRSGWEVAFTGLKGIKRDVSLQPQAGSTMPNFWRDGDEFTSPSAFITDDHLGFDELFLYDPIRAYKPRGWRTFFHSMSDYYYEYYSGLWISWDEMWFGDHDDPYGRDIGPVYNSLTMHNLEQSETVSTPGIFMNRDGEIGTEAFATWMKTEIGTHDELISGMWTEEYFPSPPEPEPFYGWVYEADAGSLTESWKTEMTWTLDDLDASALA